MEDTDTSTTTEDTASADTGADRRRTTAAEGRRDRGQRRPRCRDRRQRRRRSTPRPQATTRSRAMRQRMAAETRRVEAIRKLCAGKHPDIEAQAIEEGWDETPHRAARPPRQPAARCRPSSRPQRPASPQVFEAVALMAAGMPTSRHRGDPTPSRSWRPPTSCAAWASRSSASWPAASSCRASGATRPAGSRPPSAPPACRASSRNIANKMLLEGYNYIEDAWRQIAKIASVNDFKEHSRYRMTGTLQVRAGRPGRRAQARQARRAEVRPEGRHARDHVRPDAPDDHQRRHGRVHRHPAPDRHGRGRGHRRRRVGPVALATRPSPTARRSSTPTTRTTPRARTPP